MLSAVFPGNLPRGAYIIELHRLRHLVEPHISKGTFDHWCKNRGIFLITMKTFLVVSVLLCLGKFLLFPYKGNKLLNFANVFLKKDVISRRRVKRCYPPFQLTLPDYNIGRIEELSIVVLASWQIAVDPLEYFINFRSYMGDKRKKPENCLQLSAILMSNHIILTRVCRGFVFQFQDSKRPHRLRACAR